MHKKALLSIALINSSLLFPSALEVFKRNQNDDSKKAVLSSTSKERKRLPHPTITVLDKEIDNIQERIGIIEQDLQKHNTQLNNVTNIQIHGLRARVTNTEAILNNAIPILNNSIASQLTLQSNTKRTIQRFRRSLQNTAQTNMTWKTTLQDLTRTHSDQIKTVETTIAEQTTTIAALQKQLEEQGNLLQALSSLVSKANKNDLDTQAQWNFIRDFSHSSKLKIESNKQKVILTNSKKLLEFLPINTKKREKSLMLKKIMFFSLCLSATPLFCSFNPNSTNDQTTDRNHFEIKEHTGNNVMGNIIERLTAEVTYLKQHVESLEKKHNELSESIRTNYKKEDKNTQTTN